MAERASTLEYRFHPGRADGPALLLLHGTGGTPDDLVELGHVLAGDAPMLAPAGPVEENGAARWFRRHAEGVFDFDDVVARAHELADFVEWARARHQLTDRPLVAVGFSNGANIAAAVALLRPDVLSHAALFAAMRPLPDPRRLDLSASAVFLANGLRDPMAPIRAVDELVEMLEQRGAAVATHRHQGGHQLTPDSVAAAKTWLSSVGQQS